MAVNPAIKKLFHRVWVTTGPDNSKLIQWRLSSKFPLENPLVGFYVEWARAGADWTRITDLLVGECCHVDVERRRSGIRNNAFYRVVATDGLAEFPSEPAHTHGMLDQRRDWLAAREIMRGAYTHLVKGNGVFGYLLKRRTDGPRCSSVDHDTEEPVGCCNDCYGTGYAGGYYKPIPYWVDLGANLNRLVVQDPIGTIDPSINNLPAALAWPELNEYDVWVHGQTNARYRVASVDQAVKVRDVPLIYGIRTEFVELPISDPVYDFPILVEDVPSAISSCAAAADMQMDVNFAEWTDNDITFVDQSL